MNWFASRSRVETEIRALYNEFINDLEDFVSQFNAGLEEPKRLSQNDRQTAVVATSVISTTIHLPTMELNVKSGYQAPDFRTLGPDFALAGVIPIFAILFAIPWTHLTPPPFR